MFSAHEKAIDFLNFKRYEYLLNQRAEIYQDIEEKRAATILANEVIRPQLKAEIKRLGDALTECRANGIVQGNPIYDTLVEQIRAVNHERAHNRAEVKLLAEEQAINKAVLAELNREISYTEADFEYEDAIESITYH